MGWFDEQIRQRKMSDQEVFEEAVIQVAGAILGQKVTDAMKDDRILTKDAIDEILKYYHCKPGELPEKKMELEEQLNYLLRPHGLLWRGVELQSGWYRDAFGPMVGIYKEGGIPIALLPSGLAGYSYLDPTTGKRCRLTRKREELFEKDGMCFYRPFPLRKLNIRDLFQYVLGCFSLQDVALMLLASLAVTLIGMMLPILSRALTGSVLNSKNTLILIGMAIFLASTTISSNLLNSFKNLVSQRVDTKLELNVQAATMMRILTTPVNFFRQFSAGELSTRLNSVSEICRFLMNSVFQTGVSSLLSLAYVGQIFRFAPALVAPALVIICLTVGISILSMLMQQKITRAKMEISAKEQGMSYALITGIQKIKLAGAERRAFSRWASLYAKEVSLQYSPPMFLRLQSVIMLTLNLVGNIVLYYLAVKSHVKVADYYAFTAAYGMVLGTFSSLAGIALSVASMKPVLDMAKPILEIDPEVSRDKAIVTSLAGGIELNNVSFRYREDTPWIIDDLSLKIRRGEYIAIVGYTGCGKSTLMRLLLGFEKPEKGAIYYDGRDLESLDLQSLRRHIGTVIQNGGLLEGDIFSNITICAPWLTMDDAWEETAGIADDIRNMPMGMGTIIGEGQGGISGGQKQRLMIARAIASKPTILMFDEATSALDNKTQKQLSDALDKLKCTRIIIAHRLSTIRHCDRILVLDKGKIIENGTYDELNAKGGFFAELVKRQQV